MSWRNACLVLALVCAYQAWRGCMRPVTSAGDALAECDPDEQPRIDRMTRSDVRSSTVRGPAEHADGEDVAAPSGLALGGFQVPAWAMWFAPQPGEDMLAYRDRLLPIAQAALAPHRSRVARGRDDFAAKVGLDAHQRTELDSAVQEAAGAIQDRVLGAVLSGDLLPASFKPMTGVAVARDVLDTIARANQRFVTTLREDQRAKLATHPFDFADYLLFSARWEDALGVMN
jgi:hypothetical protein